MQTKPAQMKMQWAQRLPSEVNYILPAAETLIANTTQNRCRGEGLFKKDETSKYGRFDLSLTRGEGVGLAMKHSSSDSCLYLVLLCSVYLCRHNFKLHKQIKQIYNFDLTLFMKYIVSLL